MSDVSLYAFSKLYEKEILLARPLNVISFAHLLTFSELPDLSIRKLNQFLK